MSYGIGDLCKVKYSVLICVTSVLLTARLNMSKCSTPVGGPENSFFEKFDLTTLLRYLHFIQVTNPFIIMFNEAIEYFFRIYIFTRRWLGELETAANPGTSSRICITFSNSPSSLSVTMRLCKHGKVVLLL